MLKALTLKELPKPHPKYHKDSLFCPTCKVILAKAIGLNAGECGFCGKKYDRISKLEIKEAASEN